MKTYYYLQLKRIARALPYLLLVTTLLFGSLIALFRGILNLTNDRADQKLFQIAIVGDTEHSFLQFGLSALESFDSSRFAIKLVKMDEATARESIESGDISAYVVIPNGFMEDAIHGEVGTLKYVTTPGSIGLVSIFKDEITKVVSDVVVHSQKGTYGLADAMDENGLERQSPKKLNDISIEYVDFILSRSNMYQTEILGIADKLPLPLYFFCGIAILFLLLIGLPCAPLYIKKDLSLNRVLSAKGLSGYRQIFCELGGYFLSTVVILLLIGTGGFVLSKGMLDQFVPLSFFTVLQLLPLVAMITAFSFLLFEMTSDLISGILLQFFLSLALAYVSGCLYPIFAFPETVQKISAYLPTGLARTYLANCLTEENPILPLLGIVLYLILFVYLIGKIRNYKILRTKG